ncbi:glycosyl transferase family 90-domain-containing protein [Podospora didyma]|uniref:Glycosyl transferase family 90-domain-containing protein n=1 Tax=Podospora didyma TaxID=330526 RepID=A0AAE0NG91_9PEZI|nr:glycosyl transferase family 90-domain-containing protein [Podospora didyma]
MSETKAIPRRNSFRRQYRRWWKQAFVFASLCLLLNFLLFAHHLRALPGFRLKHILGHTPLPGNRGATQSRFNSLNLDEEQCRAAFPDLAKDIDQNVALGGFPFPLRSLDNKALTQYSQQLYILRSEHDLTPELVDAQYATLQQIHRALVTSPDSLPDTAIAINIRDQPFGAAWSYSRPAYAMPSSSGPPITRAFLMPHFSFWAWPQPFIGSLSRAAAAIDAIEASLPFSKKNPRAIWRGTVGFNSVHHPTLRQDLLNATEGRSDWADVEALKWEEGNDSTNKNKSTAVPSNAIMVEDFCRHKYVLHTEGVTYSGRLLFLQMCKSVLIAPPLAWLQHTTHLIRPLFSSDLYFSGNKRWEPSEGEKAAWPEHYTPDEANAIFVSPDWSDLEAVVGWLERNPDIAEGIATRQRELFVGGGYLSRAAEVCYWRALIRGWSQVAQTEVPGEDGTGGKSNKEERWEEFSMRHV